MKRYVSIFCVLAVIIGTLFTTAFSADAVSKNLLLGDANVDNKVNVKDATAVQKHTAGITTLTEDGFIAADVDGNGKINIKDATAIQKYVAGIKLDFPIGGLMNSNDSTNSTEPEPTNPEKPSDINEFSPTDANTNDAVTDEMLAKIEAGFFRLVNEERVSLGLASLEYNKHLDDVAQIRSSELLTVYSHTRPDGTSWASLVDREIYYCSALGENISYESQLTDETYHPSKDVFTGSDEQIELIYTKIFNYFKNSPVHYENLIHENFEHTGIGISVKYLPDIDIPFFYVSHIFGSDF